MATETTKAPAGLRTVFASTKTAIAETRDPAAVLKALIPMLREHAADMKAKAKAAKAAPVKGARKPVAVKPRKVDAPAAKPKSSRARKTPMAPAAE